MFARIFTHCIFLKFFLRSSFNSRPSCLTLRSLDITHINDTHHVDLSHKFDPRLHILPTLGRQHIIYSYGEVRDNPLLRIQAAFPSNTRGFLYYHCPIHTPATAGEIRFKMEKSFRDLCLPNALPWHIPLLRIATQTRYRGFRKLLLRNKLVTPQLLERCQKLVLSSASPLLDEKQPSTVIHSLKQPFSVDFGNPALKFWLLADHNIRRGYLDLRFGSTSVPYMGMYIKNECLQSVTESIFFCLAGSAICQLERSQFPGHGGQPILVMRLVNCDSVARTHTSFSGAPTGHALSLCNGIQRFQDFGIQHRQNKDSGSIIETRVGLTGQEHVLPRGS